MPAPEGTLPPEPTATATFTPTHTPTPAPIYLPLLFRQVRVLTNGGFETGRFAPSWLASGLLGRQIVSGGLPRTGRYAALLGEPRYDSSGHCPVGQAIISQTIDVGDDGHPTLRLWYRIWSYDTIDYDFFAIAVLLPATQRRERVYQDGCTLWTGNLWSSGWREAVISLDNYRGQTISIELANAMTNADGWYNTWTYVDDVSLSVTP
jgi:hypothetical protein